jgi:peptidyl-dipeptidase Dcp
MKVLTSKFDTKYDTAPFQRSKRRFFPAFQEGIALAKAEIDAIVADKDKPTFENTIEALDFSGYALDRISSIFQPEFGRN